MAYLSVTETAKKWEMSERSVRNYCAQGRIEGAFLTGKTWVVPDTAVKPDRKERSDASRLLVDVLQSELNKGTQGGICSSVLVDLTYSSLHMEGNEMSHDMILQILKDGKLISGEEVSLYDLIQVIHHFTCVESVIDHARYALSDNAVRQLANTLNAGIPDSLSGHAKVHPSVSTMAAVSRLIEDYNAKEDVTLADLLDFHCAFIRLNPYGEDTGIIARLLLFRECLYQDIVPFILSDSKKMFYERGLARWKTDKSYLLDTCTTAQKSFKGALDYFGIQY